MATVTYMKRGEGKTTLAIQEARRLGAAIITPFKRHIEGILKDEYPKPLIVGVDELHKLKGQHLDVVVDDADLVLADLIKKTEQSELLSWLLHKNGVQNVRAFIFNH